MPNNNIDSPVKQQLLQILVDAKNAKGLTFKQLADKTGIRHTYLCGILGNYHNITLERFIIVSNALGYQVALEPLKQEDEKEAETSL